MLSNNNAQIPPQPTLQSDARIAESLLYQQNQEQFSVIQQIFVDFSIPLSLRSKFYTFWNNIILGNYTERDINWLMLKFDEWRVQFLWYIPDTYWNNAQDFEGDSTDRGDTADLSIDLNMLLNSLQQLFFINLTRGREGFTMKWLNTSRGIIEAPTDQPKKARWF